MKKMILILIFIMTAGLLIADDLVIVEGNTATAKSKTIIVYDPIKHTQTASNIFMTWAGLSLGSGIIASTSKDPVGSGIGVANLIYGAVETTLAIININWTEKTYDQEKARTVMIEDSGWRAWTGVGHFVTGVNVGGKDIDLRGIGIAMALQGSFISVTNFMNYSIAKDPVNIRDWNAGIEVKFPLYSATF
jgi:hypothetical protein